MRLRIGLALAFILGLAGASFGQCVSTGPTLMNGSAGTNSTNVTGTILDQSTWGPDFHAGGWAQSILGAGTIQTWSNTLTHVLGGALPKACTHPLSTSPDAGTLSLKTLSSGTSANNDFSKSKLTFPVAATPYQFAYWFYIDTADTTTPMNNDMGIIHSVATNQFSTSSTTNGGVTEHIGMETATQGACVGNQATSPTITVPNRHWFHVAEQGSGDITQVVLNRMQVKDANGNVILTSTSGTEINWKACYSTTLGYVQFGITSGGTMATGFNIYITKIETCSGCTFPLDPAPPITYETAANGSGSVITSQDVNFGDSVTMYAIQRAAYTNAFVANVAVTWATSGTPGNLVPAGDNKSAVYTGGTIEAAAITAYDATAVYANDPGITLNTVSPLIAATTTVETKADGTGVVVPIQSIPAAATITGYSISRDGSGNYIGNVTAVWSLTSATGGVTGTDLVAAGNNKSAVFTGHVAGSGVMTAVANTFTGHSGKITVATGVGSGIMRGHP